MPRPRAKQKSRLFKLGANGRRRYPHRCLNPRGAHGRGRHKCYTRMTFDHWGQHPACPACGSRLHWTIDVYRASKTETKNTTCRDSRCSYPFPHQVTARECVNNPRQPSDYFGLSQTAAIDPAGDDDPGW